MKVIRLTKMVDLALASHTVESFHQEKGIASTPQKLAIASRPLTKVALAMLYKWLFQMNAFMGYVVLKFILSVQCGGVEVVLDEEYRQHSLHVKGIGEPVLERLFRTMAALGVRNLALEIQQKNFNAIQFFNSLEYPFRKSYYLTIEKG